MKFVHVYLNLHRDPQQHMAEFFILILIYTNILNVSLVD